MSLRILVVGSGGREHALAWRLDTEPENYVCVAPGNEFISARMRCLPVNEREPAEVVALARAEKIDLVVIGGEAPLAAGVVDALDTAKIAVFGPTRAAAALESSKAFAKDVMRAAGVPTPEAVVARDVAEAERALDRFGPPYVVKANGLAQGKGVRVTPDRSAAVRFAADCLEHGRFGAAGEKILIEEFVEGPEISMMAVSDGVRFLLLPAARDYKRAHDGDVGPNTGGMGAYAPVAEGDAALERWVSDKLIGPVISAMAGRGTPFRGVLYAGLVLGAQGPRVLEFNARFGDPETQAVVPLLRGEFSELLRMAARGELVRVPVMRTGGAAVAVALVDETYPEAPKTRGRIEGLDGIEEDGVRVFGAALTREGEAWRVSGGRLAYVMAHADSLSAAHDRAYAAIGRLGGSGWRCRGDIAAVPDGVAPTVILGGAE